MTNPTQKNITVKNTEQTSDLANLPTDVLIEILAKLPREAFLETTFNLLQTASVFYKLRDNSNFWALAYSYIIGPLSVTQDSNQTIGKLFTDAYKLFLAADKEFSKKEEHLANILTFAQIFDERGLLFLLKKLVANKSDFLKTLPQESWREIRNAILEHKTEHWFLALMQNPDTIGLLLGITIETSTFRLNNDSFGSIVSTLEEQHCARLTDDSLSFIVRIIQECSPATVSACLIELEKLYDKFTAKLQVPQFAMYITTALLGYDLKKAHTLSFQALIILRKFSKNENSIIISNMLINNKDTRNKFISYLINNQEPTAYFDFKLLYDLLKSYTITFEEIKLLVDNEKNLLKFIREADSTLKAELEETFFSAVTIEGKKEYLADNLNREIAQLLSSEEPEDEENFYDLITRLGPAKFFKTFLIQGVIKYGDQVPDNSKTYSQYLAEKEYFGDAKLKALLKAYQNQTSLTAMTQQTVTSFHELPEKQVSQQAMLDNATAQLERLELSTAISQTDAQAALGSEIIREAFITFKQ